MTEKKIKEILKQETEISPEVKNAVEDALNVIKNTSEKKQDRRIKKRRWQMLLPAAAIIALSTGVLAAGANWLYRQLDEKGIAGADAEKIVDMEPEQETEELTDKEYGGRKPKEKEWKEPMLTVEGAYFDGYSLHFVAKESEEAKNYDLYLRDHASINGKDSITNLQKIEDEDIYYGNIEIWNKDEASAVLESDSTVEVTMTVQAYPRYEGQIYYTWKDADAYEKFYKIGAFTDEDGKPCYALPAEDVYGGYTPQQLTLTIPLKDEAKELIKKYQDEGKIVPVQNLPESTSGEEDAVIENTEEKNMSEEEVRAFVKPPEINGNHVTCTMAGEKEPVIIDAQLVGADKKVSVGSLKYEPVPIEAAKTVYGKPENWKQAEGEYMEGTLKYQDKHIYLGFIDNAVHFDVSEATDDESIAASDTEDQKEMVQGLMDTFGLPGSIKVNKLFTRDGMNYYDMQMLLEDVPVAELSQVYYKGYAQFENGVMGGFQLPRKLTVETSEEAELLSIEKVMELVNSYVENRSIGTSSLCSDITEIRLEYYIDKTASGIVYRPVWNFETADGDDYFYIDAVTGALIRDLWGWG